MNSNTLWAALLVLTCVFSSCKESNNDIDVSNIEVSLQIIRFDNEITALKTNGIDKTLPTILENYGSFFELYSNQIIKVGSSYSADFQNNMTLFLQYELFNDINNEITRIFGDTGFAYSEELQKAFKHYKHYFPKAEIPVIYTFNGGFNQSIVIDSSLLAIGLDKYLGIENSLYKRLTIERFRLKNMYPEKLISDCMTAMAESEFPFAMQQDNLLSHMIYEGRKLYFSKKMTPMINDTVLFGFTTAELLFCQSNEKNMWDYLIDNKLLFDSDYMNIKRFVGEGPFTTAFSKNSPSRAACWIGYNIICSYVENSKTPIGLAELMNEKDAQKIINRAKYKP